MGCAISSPQSIGVDYNEAARRLQQAMLNRVQGARVNLGEQVPGAGRRQRSATATLKFQFRLVCFSRGR
jgi:hypothetical protein